MPLIAPRRASHALPQLCTQEVEDHRLQGEPRGIRADHQSGQAEWHGQAGFHHGQAGGELSASIEETLLILSTIFFGLETSEKPAEIDAENQSVWDLKRE